jgi:hypothetical protein
MVVLIFHRCKNDKFDHNSKALDIVLLQVARDEVVLGCAAYPVLPAGAQKQKPWEAGSLQKKKYSAVDDHDFPWLVVFLAFAGFEPMAQRLGCIISRPLDHRKPWSSTVE